MKTKYIVLSFVSLLLAPLFMVSCGGDTQRNEVNLENLDDIEGTIGIDELFGEVRYIEIESPNGHAMGTPTAFYYDSTKILLEDRNTVLLYNSMGKFVNAIGKQGHGHGEYGTVSGKSYDTRREQVVVLSNWQKVLRYDLSGSFVGEIQMPEMPGRLMAVKWSNNIDRYVCETRDYKADGLDIHINVVDIDGNLCYSKSVYSDHESVNTHNLRQGLTCSTTDGFFYITHFDNKLLRITADSIKAECVFNRGSFTPSRDMVEEPEKSGEYNRLAYHFQNIVATPKYFLLCIEHNAKQYYLAIDRKENKVVYNRCEENYSMLGKNRAFHFWPWQSNDSHCYVIMSPMDMDENDKETLIRKAKLDTNASYLNPVFMLSNMVK